MQGLIAIKLRDLIRRVREALNAGQPARALDFDETERPLVRELVAAGCDVQFVEPVVHSLEKIYMELVGDEEGPSE